MTGHDDFDRTLASWFESEAVSPASASDLDRVLDATRRRRPRPGWLSGFGSDWVGKAPHAGPTAGEQSLPRLVARWSTALILLVVLAALVGGAILAGARLIHRSPLPVGSLGHLAYGLDGSIYVADWDGSNPVQIAHGVFDQGGAGPAGCGSFWGEGPMWSPDGLHLAYRGAWDAGCPGASEADNVYLSDPAGRVVAAFLGTGWRVSWSPDSTRVATSVDLGHSFGIYGLDGVRQALLAVPAGYEVHGDYDPVWSPDGMSLLMPIARSGPSETWEFPIDGGTPHRVPNEDPRSHFGAAYSGDGSQVAYIDTPASFGLVVGGADGTVRRALTGAVNSGYGPKGADYRSPVVSPTGDRVAFIWSPAFYDSSADPAAETNELRMLDVASGAVTTLATGSGTDQLGVIGFSPRGDQILFSRFDANSVGTSLWSVHTDGSHSQLLVTGTGWGDWQRLPDGS